MRQMENETVHEEERRASFVFQGKAMSYHAKHTIRQYQKRRQASGRIALPLPYNQRSANFLDYKKFSYVRLQMLLPRRDFQWLLLDTSRGLSNYCQYIRPGKGESTMGMWLIVLRSLVSIRELRLMRFSIIEPERGKHALDQAGKRRGQNRSDQTKNLIGGDDG